MNTARAELPIDVLLPQLTEALRNHASLVVRAPTGAGKTTRVPPAILDSGIVGDKQIIMLEPRRLAARAAARRMAFERRGAVGEEVGYQVRLDRKAGPRTRILVVTEGVLLRMLIDDHYLDSTAAVVLDEFHERSLDSDLALGMLSLLQSTVRPDLRLVVMSATLDVAAVSKYLGNCPILTSEGRTFPVEIRYEPRSVHVPWPQATAQAVQRLLDCSLGDVLVFLPGVGEIHQTAKHLERPAGERRCAVVPLYGDLPPDAQDAALNTGSQRRVVLATNVAETSVTVAGVTGVVDTGLVRRLQFDPRMGLDRLVLGPISKASADQRAGRAGRTEPGICVRLWSPVHQGVRADQEEPEIRRLDLAGTVLQLHALGEHAIDAFPWFEAPRAESLQHATDLLLVLGCLDHGRLTPLGRQMARLPLHPRLGRLLIEGRQRGITRRAALAAALLAERDPFMSPRTNAAPRSRASTDSDVSERVDAIEEFERTGSAHSAIGSLQVAAARHLLRSRDQLVRLIERAAPDSAKGPSHSGTSGPCDLQQAVFAAFCDRLARRREPGSARGVMVGGRGVRLDMNSSVHDAELFVCLDVDAGKSESRVRLASAVQREWLRSELFATSIDVQVDGTTGRVTARRRTRYRDLLLDEAPAPLPDDATVAAMLADAALGRISEILPAPDSPAGNFLTRLGCLRLWMPELELPELDEQHWRQVLPWLCHGRRDFNDLRNADWETAVNQLLTPQQRTAMSRDAPARIQVPSGSVLALTYEFGRPPVLAVRIQEIFGLRETPSVARGRVRVLLQLLGPNYRPQQITDDLESFWKNTYPQIRKELRRRYPRHAWPDDPLSAQPERRPGPRKK